MIIFCLKYHENCQAARALPSDPGAGPAPRGAFQAVPPNHSLCSPKREMCPPNEDCAPKTVTGSVPLECSSGPETPEILVINPVISGKNRFFADFAFFCFWSSPQNWHISRWSPFFWSSSQNSWNFAHISRRLFFFVFIADFVEFRVYFVMKTFFVVFTLNSREKSFCAPQKTVYAPLPQSRYFDAGPAPLCDML